MTPAVGRDTTTACGISGRIQYRPHNADRSERRLLNVLPRTEKPSPPRGRCRRSRRMRCRLRVAEPFTGEKVTLFSVTRCCATPHHRLRAELSRCGSGRRGSRSPPETDSLPRPCFAALKGEAKVRVVPRGSTNARFLPEYRNFLRCVRCLCQLPLPACPFPGGSRGAEPH